MDVHPPKNGINRYWSIAIWNSPITYAMCPVVLEATHWACTSQHLLVVLTVFPKNRNEAFTVVKGEQPWVTQPTSTNINQLVHLWTSMVDLKLAVWLISICTFRHQGLQSFLYDVDHSLRRVRNVHHPSSDHQISPAIPQGHAKATEVTAISERWRSSHELHLDIADSHDSPWCKKGDVSWRQHKNSGFNKAKWLVLGGFNQPLWKMMEFSSVGIMTFPQYMESHSKAMFQSPPTNG